MAISASGLIFRNSAVFEEKLPVLKYTRRGNSKESAPARHSFSFPERFLRSIISLNHQHFPWLELCWLTHRTSYPSYRLKRSVPKPIGRGVTSRTAWLVRQRAQTQKLNFIDRLVTDGFERSSFIHSEPSPVFASSVSCTIGSAPSRI